MTDARSPRRVLVADSHPLQAQGVAAVLRADPELWVQVSEVPPGRLATLDGAQVAVLGIDGDVRGIWRSCDHLQTLGIELVALVLLLPGRSEFEMTAAASIGAAAVLPRSASVAALREAVDVVADGRRLVAPGMAERMLDDFAGMLRRSRERSRIDLTAREVEVLQLVAEGRSNRAIAGSLHIADNTVKNHVRRIMEKLGAGSRTEAVALAVRSGVLVMGGSAPPPAAPAAG